MHYFCMCIIYLNHIYVDERKTVEKRLEKMEVVLLETDLNNFIFNSIINSNFKKILCSSEESCSEESCSEKEFLDWSEENLLGRQILRKIMKKNLSEEDRKHFRWFKKLLYPTECDDFRNQFENNVNTMLRAYIKYTIIEEERVNEELAKLEEEYCIE